MAEKRVQRRLAAILAADVVGYSRVIAADEDGIYFVPLGFAYCMAELFADAIEAFRNARPLGQPPPQLLAA